jgi:hypothetical protein
MSKNTKMLLDRWIFRAIWIVLIVTTVGFVATMLGVI